jgi:hypothetical protein
MINGTFAAASAPPYVRTFEHRKGQAYVGHWGLTNSGLYTVRSMYLGLLSDNTKYLKTYIWKMKVLVKIKIFMWFLHRKVILTNDNLLKKLDSE